MDDGTIFRYSCCDYVGGLLYTDSLGQARKCTLPWPECISSDARGVWQYLLPCRLGSDRQCADCNNPNKPPNSHYVESPRTYPGFYECRWVCDAGYFEAAGTCRRCGGCGLGQTVSQPCNATVDTQCGPCPTAPRGAYFPFPGSCAWNCTADFFVVQGGCEPCPMSCDAGLYRRDCGGDGAQPCGNCTADGCVPCTNRPPDRIARFFSTRGVWEEAAVRTFYTGAGSWRGNDCPWACDVGYYPHPQLGCAECTNRPNPLLPVGNWTCFASLSGGSECLPAFVNSSYYTGPGSYNANDCPWRCAAGFQLVGSECADS